MRGPPCERRLAQIGSTGKRDRGKLDAFMPGTSSDIVPFDGDRALGFVIKAVETAGYKPGEGMSLDPAAHYPGTAAFVQQGQAARGRRGAGKSLLGAKSEISASAIA